MVHSGDILLVDDEPDVRQPVRHLKIIVISGGTRLGDGPSLAADLDADAVLAKSFGARELLTLPRDVLNGIQGTSTKV